MGGGSIGSLDFVDHLTLFVWFFVLDPPIKFRTFLSGFREDFCWQIDDPVLKSSKIVPTGERIVL